MRRRPYYSRSGGGSCAYSRHIKARKKALDVEKERAAQIASLPPPPPDPLQNIEVVKRLPSVKVCNVDSFSTSHYHLPEAYVDREMDTEQTDARSAAVEEEKRLNALLQEEERDRREQMEKTNLRGSRALKLVQLAQGPTGHGWSPTISSGSFLTSEKTDSSPGNSAPEVAADVTASDNHLSYTFHSLDPKPDFNISTPSCGRSDATRSPQNMPDWSQSSSNTSRSPVSQVPHSTPALSSSVRSFHSLNIGRSSPRRQNQADFSGSFLPLHPECTLNEPNLSRHEDPPCAVSAQDQGAPFQRGVLQSFDAASHDASHRPFTSQHSSTIQTSAAEDSGSFHALVNFLNIQSQTSWRGIVLKSFISRSCLLDVKM